MKNTNEYLEINKTAWNNKVPYHIASTFYDNEQFIKGKTSLKEAELCLLGPVEGLKIAHLQCHFGQDSISLSRIGAIVTGVDFSNEAIEQARILALKCGQSTHFVEDDVYSFNKNGSQKYDLVFTSYGTIGWLPELNSWAKTISRSLRKGGRFVMVDFHPFVWTFDDEMRHIAYDYFNTQTIIETTNGTYADRHAPLFDETHSWNHTISDILQALIKNNLKITNFLEYPYSSYDCFTNLKKVSEDKFVFNHIEAKIPMMYGIEAIAI